MTGKQVATYYFSGQQAQSTLTSVWNTPGDGDYLITDKFVVESIVWSPCGANLPINVNSQLALTSTIKDAAGVLTTDSENFKFSQIFHLQWRQC